MLHNLHERAPDWEKHSKEARNIWQGASDTEVSIWLDCDTGHDV